jgi:hypothetical protein
MKRVFRRPSPAMVIAMVALLVALGGTAIAATVLSKHQVKNIAKSVLKQRTGRITRVVGPTVSIPPGNVGSATATCPAGQGVVNGSYSYISAGGTVFYEDTFGSSNKWAVGGDNFDAQFTTGDLTPIVFCAPAAKAVTAARSARSDARSFDARVDEAVARQKAKHGL